MTEPGADEVATVAASLRVVSGQPDDEELAALVAGVVAYATTVDSDDETPGSPTSAWMDRSRTMRGRRAGVLSRGDTAWRHSLR